MEAAQVWSCGGGTQSAAIAALIVQGRLPKPDYALIVDTNREKSGTWAYLDNVLRPELAKVGVEIARVDRSVFSRVDLYSINGDSLLLPFFTSQKGEVSKVPAYCSVEWKQRVATRWMRTQGITTAVNWLGISTDEMSRVRTPHRAWLQLRYPLIFDVPMSRRDCMTLIAEMGWPEAPRSSCWMCPNMRDAEWREMKADYPEDFARAVALESELRATDPHVWLHESAKPLDEVDFTNYQSTLFAKGCDSGHCFT